MMYWWEPVKFSSSMIGWVFNSVDDRWSANNRMLRSQTKFPNKLSYFSIFACSLNHPVLSFYVRNCLVMVDSNYTLLLYKQWHRGGPKFGHNVWYCDKSRTCTHDHIIDDEFSSQSIIGSAATDWSSAIADHRPPPPTTCMMFSIFGGWKVWLRTSSK